LLLQRREYGKKVKEKQIDINHTQDGIGHNQNPVGRGEGEEWDKRRRRDKKAHDAE
jgi:hypothetical protein